MPLQNMRAWKSKRKKYLVEADKYVKEMVEDGLEKAKVKCLR